MSELYSFKGRELLIATMHQKEKVMRPILERGLGVICTVPNNFDTDIFGTFSGEIARDSDALITARKKCLEAMDAFNCDLVVASEGSFGAHPAAFFAAGNDELVLLLDRKNDIEVMGRVVSFKTNFAGSLLTDEKELWDFANQINFPSHALILRPDKESTLGVVKGIVSPDVLLATFLELKAKYNSVYAETDMRALYNPTRMEVIATATEQLVKNVLSICPECQTPGFVVTSVNLGLPCDWCGSATSSALSHVYVCKKCQCSTEVMYPNNKKTEQPDYCNYCNP